MQRRAAWESFLPLPTRRAGSIPVLSRLTVLLDFPVLDGGAKDAASRCLGELFAAPTRAAGSIIPTPLPPNEVD